MKNIILTLLSILVSVTATAEECEVRFSEPQLWVLQESFERGIDEDYSFTLAAISWQESSAGVNLYRSDGDHWSMKSYGTFQILLRTAKNRVGCQHFQCNGVKHRLTVDFDFGVGLAIEELVYWERRLGSRENAIAAYNTGNNWQSKAGKNYLFEIQSKKLYLERCIRF